MQVLMEASIRNSDATRQIAYLLMLFRPADSVAVSTTITSLLKDGTHHPQECFRMNVTALNPESKGKLVHFIEAAIPLTVASVCIVLAFRTKAYVTDLRKLFTRKGRSHDRLRHR
jgi:hypothetical protein